MVERLNVGHWGKFVRSVIDAGGPTLLGRMRGALGAVALLDQTRNAAVEIRNRTVGNVFILRGLGTFDRDAKALSLRIEGYLAVLRDAPNLEVVEALVITPIVRGLYPAQLFEVAGPGSDADMFQRTADGGRKLGGDILASATLWNQALAATDVTGLDPSWAESAMAAVITQAAREFEASAPGEDPTLSDAVSSTLIATRDTAAQLFNAIGGSRLLLIAGAAVAAYLLALALRR